MRLLKSILAAVALLSTGTANATCPSVTFPGFTYHTDSVAASSGNTTDAGGNVWAWSMPAIPAGSNVSVPITLTPANCNPPSNAFTTVFWFTSNNLSPDDGYNGCGEGAIVGDYNAGGNSGQRWTWDANNHLIGSGAGCTTGLKDSNGTAVMSATPDALTIAGTSSTYTFTILDQVTGRYLGLSGSSTGAPGSLVFSSTQTAWGVSAVHN